MSAKSKRSAQVSNIEVTQPSAQPVGFGVRCLQLLERRAVPIAIALVLLATIRIIATYSVLSYTFDEPAHLAAGMEWLDRHSYTYETQHPPLTRVMAALLPRLSGLHSTGQKGIWDEGLAILASGGKMDQTLALARAGMLPFFWIACWVIFLMACYVAGSSAAGVLAVFLVTIAPPVLAHAGLATTDMGLTALFLAAVYTGWRWWESPDIRSATRFGACLGLAVLAKFSTLAFFPVVALIGVVTTLYFDREFANNVVLTRSARLMHVGIAAGVAIVLIWAGNQFSLGKPPGFSVPVPAPEVFRGIAEVRRHDATGHLTYLMGAANTVGWWYFYLVALAVKTPIPILLFGIAGLILLLQRSRFATRGWLLWSTILGILIFSSFFTQIKIGTRHVLPVYFALCAAAACAIEWLLTRLAGRRLVEGVVVLLLLWTAVDSAVSHPDYLGYFNALAAGKPEQYLVDSDLDWGQDVKRLAAKLHEVGAREVFFNQYAPGDLQKLFGFPPITPLDFKGPHPGWNAVSVTPLKYGLFGGDRYVYDPGYKFWPEQDVPVARVGSGILLYYRPPNQ